MNANVKAMAFMAPASIVFLIKSIHEKADNVMIAYLSIMVFVGTYSIIEWVKKE